MVEAQKERAVEIDVAVHSQSPPGALPVPKTATGIPNVAASREHRFHTKRWEFEGHFQGTPEPGCATLCLAIAPPAGTGQKPPVSDPIILLDGPQRGRLLRFAGPLAVIEACDPAGIGSALAALEEARAKGHYLAGYFGYELGYVLEPRLGPLLPEGRNGPLLWFGVFDACEEVPAA